MIKLRKGNAPTITKGPYAGEIVTGDHITNCFRKICRLVRKKSRAAHVDSHQGMPLRKEN